MRIDFDEEKHEYSVGGIKIPSVSEILAPLSADRYRDLNPAVLQQAAARGTAIHEATQAIDYGAEPEPNPDLDGYLEAYMKFLWEHEVEWHMIEQIVYYNRTEDELPIYAGTVDRYGLVDGVPTVVDIKTYASLTTDSQLAASCQTALYRDALEEVASQYIATWVKQNRAILHLRKDGTYRLVNLDEWDEKHGFNSRSTAWMLYELWSSVNAARKTVRKKREHSL